MVSIAFALTAIKGINVSAVNNSSPNNRTQKNKIDTLDVYGVIIKKQFANAAGRLSDSLDYYFEFSDSAKNKVGYYIKFSESNVSKKFIEEYLKKDFIVKSPGHLVYLRVVLRNGLWDTNDPNIQSRVGPYVAIIEVFGCNGK